MINLRTRELVLSWIKEGKTQQEIAELIGCNQSAVSRLIVKYKKTGNVRNMPRSGRPTPLTKKMLAKLKSEFQNEARTANRNYCSTDVKQFARLIERRTEKKYTLRHVERILHRLDFSRIILKPQHIRDDPKKVKEFRVGFEKT